MFELIVEAPQLVCVIAGNHDEALSYGGKQFASSVVPSDFADFLNANLAHEWIERAGKLALRLTAHAPRALFFPDGLLVAHGGFPLADLHPALLETGDWNNPGCLSDFVWSRAHPKARRKMPNRFSRGSQFGYEDFADFCCLSARLGRPVTHMARGHDHVEERYAIYPAYHANPVLTTVALSRRLDRERFGPYERAPTLARVIAASLPQVYQLHPPAELIQEVFPPGKQDDGADSDLKPPRMSCHERRPALPKLRHYEGHCRRVRSVPRGTGPLLLHEPYAWPLVGCEHVPEMRRAVRRSGSRRLGTWACPRRSGALGRSANEWSSVHRQPPTHFASTP